MMKKLLIVTILVLGAYASQAQRWCYVSSEYILNKMPEFSAAQKQVDALSDTWAKEIDNRSADIAKMYRTLEAEKALLTDEMLKRRKSEIELKEKELSDLQQKRFGFEGDLFKKKQELINEQASKNDDITSILESKLAKLEAKIEKLTEGK
jgi:outer membrane protein